MTWNSRAVCFGFSNNFLMSSLDGTELFGCLCKVSNNGVDSSASISFCFLVNPLCSFLQLCAAIVFLAKTFPVLASIAAICSYSESLLALSIANDSLHKASSVSLCPVNSTNLSWYFFVFTNLEFTCPGTFFPVSFMWIRSFYPFIVSHLVLIVGVKPIVYFYSQCGVPSSNGSSGELAVHWRLAWSSSPWTPCVKLLAYVAYVSVSAGHAHVLFEAVLIILAHLCSGSHPW